MEHKCPRCGADLPENAAFCPHCATDIHPRKPAKTATPLLKKLLVAWPNDRCAPAPDIYQQGAPDEQYRWPSRWYVNDAAIGPSASDSRYHDNTFTNNGTAVLLENVPTDITLDFEGTVFSGNGTDVDDRCDHPIDLSKATLE